MTIYVRCDVDNIVREIITTLPEGKAISDCYHPDMLARVHAVTGAVPREGQVRQSDGSFVDPAQIVLSKPDLLAYADRRQGAFLAAPFAVTIDGQALDTRCDDESRGFLAWLGLWASINAGTPDANRTYYNLDGPAVTVSAADMGSFLTAVGNHVQRSFDLRASVGAQIESGGVTTPAGIDAAFAAS